MRFASQARILIAVGLVSAAISAGLAIAVRSRQTSEPVVVESVSAEPAPIEAKALTESTRAPDELIEELKGLEQDSRYSVLQSRVDEALAVYPTDERLHWLKGTALLIETDPKLVTIQLQAYRRAFELKPQLIEEPLVFARVATILRRDNPPPGALPMAFAAERATMQPLLIELVARTEHVLTMDARHRVLEHLGPSAEVNHELQLVLDLWQAQQTDHPCSTYGWTVARMSGHPVAVYQASLRSAPVPEPGTGEPVELCEVFGTVAKALATDLRRALGSNRWVPAEYAHRVAPSNSSGRRRRRGWRGLFR